MKNATAAAAAIVITRPRAQSEMLAPRIAALGLRPVIFPLLEIGPLADASALQAALADLSRYALVMFVSPNAIDAAFQFIGRWPQAVAIGIVGAGSRAALERHGVNASNARIVAPADPAKTDSEGLFAALDRRALQGRRVLIVRGQDGRDFFRDALLGIGVQVEQVSAYRRGKPPFDSAAAAQLRQLLDSDSVWIVTSSEALRNLQDMLKQSGFADAVVKMQQKRLIVPHPRIAETARLAGFSRVSLTGSGDERLLAALQSET
ncbi:MAG: Uroporphyrinogen-III synthase [Herbaspirillum sp.]|jgi:uroporphyrinogen-III synthase|nr:Uroporphyrinogen-III synthase [Herbaspirillum sp.]